MRLVTRLSSFFRTLFGGTQLDRDLDDELRAYLDHEIAKRVARGENPTEARRVVLAEQGGVEPIKEDARAARVGFGVATILQDLRYGLRTMRRSPGFALVACLTLALGIGASVSVFTIMRSVLWRELPYANAERLVVIETDIQGLRNAGAAPAEIHDWRARSRTLDAIATVNEVEAHVVVNGEIERVAAISASDNLLPVLGVSPALGRHLDVRRDMGPQFVRAILISDRLWRRLGADPDIVGRSLDSNNMPLEVAGVLPPGFKMFLPAAIGMTEDIDVWFPAGIPNDREYRGFDVIGRLAPGQTAEAAARDIDAIRQAVAAETGISAKGIITRVIGMRDAMTSEVAPGLRALGFAVAFVLLVSCVNVANLMMARSTARARELAVRRALGAGRVRLLRQLLTEGLLLASIAGAAGLLLARGALGLIAWLKPTHLPRQSQVSMDVTVTLFAVGVTIGAALLFSLLPALRLATADAQALKAGRGDTSGRGARRIQRALVVGEIALSIIPLVAAGLMIRSFVNLTQAPIGFSPAGLITAKMPLTFRRFPYQNTDARVRLHLEAIDRLRTLPGVEAVSAANPIPFAPLQTSRRYGRADRAGALASRPMGTQQSIMPGYLSMAGVRLLRGRDFTAADLSAKRPVVIVDTHLASSLWPEGAIGRRMLIGSSTQELEVIGITEPVRVTHVRDESRPHFFLPYHIYPIEMTLVLKTSQPAAALAPAIKRTIAALNTGRAVHNVRPMSDYVRDSIAETRFTMLLLAGFAAASMLLAAIGLYGTLAYLTSQRAREFGVRLALGASSRQILTLVAGEGLALTAAGALVGLAGALVAARAIRGLLYGVAPVDPITLFAVTGLVCLLAIAATVRPAWAAGRVDPTSTLRAD